MSEAKYKDILEMFTGNFPLLTKMYTVYDKAVAIVGNDDTLKKSIEVTTLEVLELVVLAARQSSAHKKDSLRSVSTKLDTIKVYIDLAAQTGKITVAQAQEVYESINDVGKMIGGWIKKINAPQE